MPRAIHRVRVPERVLKLLDVRCQPEFSVPGITLELLGEFPPNADPADFGSRRESNPCALANVHVPNIWIARMSYIGRWWTDWEPTKVYDKVVFHCRVVRVLFDAQHGYGDYS